MKEQFIYVDEAGNKFYYSDRAMKVLHREDGPAVERATGTKEWWVNDKIHRKDGPAVERGNGDKQWYNNGKRHREDGPAFEGANGHKEWWINGKWLSEDEFNARMNPVELTLEDIAEKFGVSVNQLKIKK